MLYFQPVPPPCPDPVPCPHYENNRDAASRVSDDALRLLECVTLAYIEAVPPPKWIMTNLPAVLDSTDVGKQDRATGEGAGGADVVPDEAESGGVGYARIWCAQVCRGDSWRRSRKYPVDRHQGRAPISRRVRVGQANFRSPSSLDGA